MKGITWGLLASTLSACAGNHLLHSEPDPDRAAPGFAYVDFYLPGPTDKACRWQVYLRREQVNSFGKPFAIDERVDAHVYLAEMASSPHRLVRVEVIPGAQVFRIGCGFEKDTTVNVSAVEGMIVPVHVEVLGSGQRDRQRLRGTIEPPVPYRRKHEVPHGPNPERG